MKKIFIAIPLLLMLICLTAGRSFAVPLQNGDFSSGLNNWGGYIGQDSGSGLIVVPVDLNSGDSHFDASSGVAFINNDDTFYQIILSQIFDLPVAPSTLSFDYLWAPTDTSGNTDTFQASFAVWNQGLSSFNSPIDLFNNAIPATGVLTTLAYNMTPNAGQKIRLDFILTDNDFLTPDTLQIDNVITATAPIPEPTTMLLLCVGLPALFFFSRRGTRTKTV